MTTRRNFLIGAAGAAALGACRPEWTVIGGSTGPTLPSNPFTLGVASGDPDRHGVVLWTRLAPDPIAGGGMPPTDVPVRWEIARDERFAQVTKRGTAIASPEFAHSVHVDATGLPPDRWFWYRFRVGDWISPVGRTRTMPPPERAKGSMAFAFASCQSWPSGFYTAYRYMADDDLDLVVHLGDYIYEGGGSGVRAHNGGEVFTLDEYRNRHALYKTDADLQAAHAAFPWTSTWDDHEVDNNYGGDLPGGEPPPNGMLARKAAAYQAYWEHMPVRLPAPVDSNFPIFRRVEMGRYATVHLLDQRQYRTPQPCPITFSPAGPQCDEAFDPSHKMLGDQQQRWLADGLTGSRSTWDVLATGTVMTELSLSPGADPKLVNLDQWDGFPLARRQVLDAVQAAGSDAVVISGDIHASGVAGLQFDYDTPGAPDIASEFTGTSISSGSSTAFDAILPLILEANDHIRWTNTTQRGYVRCTASESEYTADYRLLDTVAVPESAITTATSWRVAAGQPGPVQTA